MKIKSVKCEQFAGIQNKNIDFAEGLNIIVGDNESGKSTIADLIYQTLFQDSKLSGTTDKDFIDKYFPKMASGIPIDVIDGSLEFSTKDGDYKIRKEWEQGGGNIRLTLPEGVSIKDKNEIEKILNDKFHYQSGVYNEIVFPSQKRNQFIIQSILNQGKTDETTKKDLSNILTKAAVETGGVSLDKIEENLNKQLSNYAERWDFSQNLPEGGVKRGIDRPWATKALIVNAYYDMERIRKAKDDASQAEINVKLIKDKLKELNENKKKLNDKRENFSKSQNIIDKVASLKQDINIKTDKLKILREDAITWPDKEKKLKEINSLFEELSLAERKEYLSEIHDACARLGKNRSERRRLKTIDASVIEDVEACLAEIEHCQKAVDGMNLIAKFAQIDSEKVFFTNAITGENIEVKKETKISEPIRIVVPDIMDVVIEPTNIDSAEISKTISNNKDKIAKVFAKYDVKSFDELKEEYQKYDILSTIINNEEEELSTLLNGESLEKMLAELEKIPTNIRNAATILLEIQDIIGPNENKDAYRGILSNDINRLKEKYNTLEELNSEIEKCDGELAQRQSEMLKINDLPEEFKNIENPEQYYEQLKTEIESLESSIDDIRDNELAAANEKLREKSADEYASEFENAEKIFNERQLEYGRLKKIYDKFYELKEQLNANPMSGIEKKFNNYLSILSSDKIKAVNIDDKLNASIISENHALTYPILSEGTKDTIALAFRLAMLENLFPNGDGIAIFDDPFTDMSPKRVAEACKLIQKFAERNQVIFITCDPKYKNLLKEDKTIEIN